MGELARRPRNSLVLALATLTILVAACGGGDEPQPGATQRESPAETTAASPAATAEGSPAASPGSTAGTEEPTVVLEPDTLAEVVVTELIVRAEPRIADDSQILEPVLGEGQRLLVLDGPHGESGYWWYLAQPLTEHDATEQLPFGWVASADRDGEPWLEAVEPECPGDPPTIEAVAELTPEERLVCLGGEDWTFSGESQSCGPAHPTIEPQWFQGHGCGYGPDTETQLAVRVPPDVTLPEGSGAREFTGHFNDPRAQECVWAGPEDPPPPPPEQVVLMCRMEFVVVSAQLASWAPPVTGRSDARDGTGR